MVQSPQFTKYIYLSQAINVSHCWCL